MVALPKSHREEPLRQVDKAVHAIESAVASVVDLRGPSLADVEAGIEEVEARMMLVEAARAELEALSPTAGSLDALRGGLETDLASPADAAPAPGDSDEPPEQDRPAAGPRESPRNPEPRTRSAATGVPTRP